MKSDSAVDAASDVAGFGAGDCTCVNVYISPFCLCPCQWDASGDTIVDATGDVAVVGDSAFSI